MNKRRDVENKTVSNLTTIQLFTKMNNKGANQLFQEWEVGIIIEYSEDSALLVHFFLQKAFKIKKLFITKRRKKFKSHVFIIWSQFLCPPPHHPGPFE